MPVDICSTYISLTHSPSPSFSSPPPGHSLSHDLKVAWAGKEPSKQTDGRAGAGGGTDCLGQLQPGSRTLPFPSPLLYTLRGYTLCTYTYLHTLKYAPTEGRSSEVGYDLSRSENERCLNCPSILSFLSRHLEPSRAQLAFKGEREMGNDRTPRRF